MANNKVQLANGTVVMDITDTTADASSVAEGAVFYSAAGVRTVGTYRYKMLHVSTTITSLPKTISDSRITSAMRVANAQFGTPSALVTNPAWTTADGSIVFSGTISGSTTADFDLIEAEE